MKNIIQYDFVEDCKSCVSYEMLYTKVNNIVNMLKSYGLIVKCSDIRYVDNKYCCSIQVLKKSFWLSKRQLDTLIGIKGQKVG